MKSIMRAIFRALRRVSTTVKWVWNETLGFVDGLTQGLFARRVVEEVEEITAAPELVSELVADDAPAPASKTPPVNLPQLAKTGLLHMESGRDYKAIFDLTNPKQAALAAWLGSLDDCGKLALRSAPFAAVARHLDTTDSWRCAGLPLYPMANAPLPAKTARVVRDFDMALAGSYSS